RKRSEVPFRRAASPRVSRTGLERVLGFRLRAHALRNVPPMFESLSSRLSDVFDRLRRHGALSEGDVEAALREIRIALLEADVALPVVRDFVNGVKEKAVGQDVLRSVTPAQMVVKIVHDHLVATLGGDADPRSSALNLNAVPPVPILMVGLQGSGKTTT